MKRQRWKVYVAWILFTEAVGALSGFLTRGGMETYKLTVRKPFLSPPDWLFPIAWGILYALMGIGAARIHLTGAEGRKKALGVYLLQLGFNFFWSVIFFSLMAFGAAFLWLAALFVLVVWMVLLFSELDRPAGLLQIPYLLWLLFAGYLNLGVWLLNR